MQDAPGSHPMTASIDLPVIDSPSDLELVAAIRSGDDFAFSRLWHRHEAAATTAAAATPGHAGVEQVVAAAAALVAHAIRHGGGPTGAARPYMLAAVREAASAADGRAAGVADGDPSLLSPADWYSDTLPEGMRDGEAVVRAYGALPVMAQEALWLAEVDGRSTADIAAELGVTVARAEGLVVESVTALDAAWADTVTASAPADSDCARVLARRSLGDRVTERLRPKVRAHLDTCATCRAAGGEPGALAERLMTSLPILVLGGAAGVAFLEATRPGSSATALEPVPPVDERGAVATLIAATGAGIAGITRAAEPVVALPAAQTAAVAAPSAAPFPVAARAAIRRIPARGRLAIAGVVGAAAAAAVVLAVSLTGPISTDLGASFEASGGTDVAEPAPGMMPPVVVATEVPADDEAPGAGTDPAPPAGPDAGAPAPAPAPSPEAGREPPQESGEPGGSGAADPGPAPTETPGETPTPRPTTPPTDEDGSSALQPGRPGAPTIRDPQSEPAPPSTPIRFEYSRPGTNGWRTLTLTGTPGASYVVTNHGDVLYTGVLGPDGTTELAVRGSVADLDVQYDQSRLAGIAEAVTGE